MPPEHQPHLMQPQVCISWQLIWLLGPFNWMTSIFTSHHFFCSFMFPFSFGFSNHSLQCFCLCALFFYIWFISHKCLLTTTWDLLWGIIRVSERASTCNHGYSLSPACTVSEEKQTVLLFKPEHDVWFDGSTWSICGDFSFPRWSEYIC